MDKGQHIRLFLGGDTVIAMATELSLHGSMQTEDSTTKDTTDSTGAVWTEFEPTGRSYEITFSKLLPATGGDFENEVSDTLIPWEIAMASGENNQTKGTVICSGQAKMTSMQASGQVGQNTTYNGTLTGFGPLALGALLAQNP